MVAELDATDAAVAERIVEIQQTAYAVEAKLIGFEGIPQLGETIADVQARTDLQWLGSFVGERLVALIAWEIDGVCSTSIVSPPTQSSPDGDMAAGWCRRYRTSTLRSCQQVRPTRRQSPST